jgi:dTDP-4-amino-4,6-dideoxygalactose transaminase
MQRRDAAAARLDARLSEIPGIYPQQMAPGATRSAHHLYIFRYVAEEFGGPEKAQFARALNAEGIPARGGYNPLYREPLFADVIPHNPDLVACGLRGPRDYSRVRCENTERLHAEGIWFTQSVLLADPEDMDDIADAIIKIRENLDEL